MRLWALKKLTNHSTGILWVCIIIRVWREYQIFPPNWDTSIPFHYIGDITLTLNSFPRPAKTSMQCTLDTVFDNENKENIFKKKTIRGKLTLLVLLWLCDDSVTIAWKPFVHPALWKMHTLTSFIECLLSFMKPTFSKMIWSIFGCACKNTVKYEKN